VVDWDFSFVGCRQTDVRHVLYYLCSSLLQVGDSVVSKGRETLQRAIALVQSRKEWRARVVYGDTDSLFVLTQGRSRQEAFKIGQEIADAVTQDNPKPVKLKLEKVYQPCILQVRTTISFNSIFLRKIDGRLESNLRLSDNR